MNPDPDDVTFQFNQIQLTDEDADVTFVFNQLSSNSVTDSSKSQQFTRENADVANDDDDVTFCFDQVQTNANEEPESQQFTRENADVANDEDDVTFCVQINTNDEPESQQFTRENADVEREGEEEFTFMCINEETVIPLFDQSLLAYNNEDVLKRVNVPVNNKVLTAVTDSNEMNIKSNSTGSSYPRRFRDNKSNMFKSNSDGRDAFVFLNKKMEGKEVVVKKKVKKANVSALEEYLRKGEEEKRKNGYLTYSRRPQQRGRYGMTRVLDFCVKKGLRAASNILSS